MQQPWFKDWFNSKYYHQLYFNRDAKEAAAFIARLIDYLKPPVGCKMLDIACGKGRHSRQLAALEFDVTGIDLSEQSIEEALQFESDNLHFFQHDMRLPFWINYFDYTFNFFTSFGYFKTQREHDDAIRTIAASLKPGGIFVMDYLNVHYAENKTIHHSEKEIDGIRFIITKWYDEDFFYKKIMIEDEALQEPLIYTEKVAKFTLGNFTEMFAYQGMQIQEIFGNYEFAGYDLYQSPRLIMMAKKTR
ncbi:MAG: class I SAM-dependent methyltransferase [Bacteroidetes bacterium]|nr:class I SAM-dependent methyltransferase [Bacteroidota bacterium]MBS1755900.1 class I SAM-dependent methyltransferase [Bacteroidota bacterium]